MLIGVIADDYTGASDIANTLAKGLPASSIEERHGLPAGGLATVQFLGVPGRAAPSWCEAGVVALKSRSIPAIDAVAQSLSALRWLQSQGCRQFIFKVCSTFDSTAAGNIGPVAEALAKALGVAGVPTCPAFPGAGRTVYRGHLFVNDHPLNESGLETHPLNPMTDANLVRWLARQSTGAVGLVHWPVVSRGPGPLRDALAASASRGETQIIVDAIRDEDLVTIAIACAQTMLMTGGSGIALGIPGVVRAAGLAGGGRAAFEPNDGPEAILAGSCSRATLEQVAVHAADHPVWRIDVDAVMAGQAVDDEIISFVADHRGQAPLIVSSMPAHEVAELQTRYGRDAPAKALDALFARIALRIVENGVTRLVTAGGETSGAVVSTLGLDALSIGPEIDPGVPALSTFDRERPLALALKSGNFGKPNFFATALAALAGTPNA